MKLSASYEVAYAEMLEAVAEWKPRKEIELAACWPDWRPTFQSGRGILVIGRATNGFEPPFHLADLRAAGGAVHQAHLFRDTAETNRLSWLDAPHVGPRMRGTVGTRSPFWRVTAAAVRTLEAAVVNSQLGWSANVAWSNLAKVAPFARGNPPESLLTIQARRCAALVPLEVEELKPQVVLVIAGAAWCDRFGTLGNGGLPWSRGAPVAAGPVLRAVREDGRLWLFCDRPESKSESVFNDAVKQAMIPHLSWLGAA